MESGPRLGRECVLEGVEEGVWVQVVVTVWGIEVPFVGISLIGLITSSESNHRDLSVLHFCPELCRYPYLIVLIQ